MNKYEAAGRILSLAQDAGIVTTQTEKIAKACATSGVTYASGLLEGLWYTQGNRVCLTDANGAAVDFWLTWKTVGAILAGTEAAS